MRNNVSSESDSKGPVVVALGPGERGAGLVRAAAALAADSASTLVCLTIETGEARSAEEGERLAEAQRLARSLGAKFESVAGADPAASLLKRAGERGASVLVLGAGRRKLLRRSLADRLLSARPPFDVVAIGQASRGPAKAGARPSPPIASFSRYLAALLAVAVVTVLNYFLAEYVGYWAAAIPYLAAISLLALSLERGPVLLAAVLSALAWDILFIPPRFTLAISRPEDAFILGLYFLVAIISGLMTGRLRAGERLLAQRETRMSCLSALARELAGAKAIESILDKSIRAIEEFFDVEALVILKDEGGALKHQAEGGWEPLDAEAREAARISFEERRSAGRYTDARRSSEWHFVPMEGPRGRLGVLGLRPASDRAWNEDLESFLRTMTQTISIAVARELSEG